MFNNILIIKLQVYDEMGDAGLKLMEQFGEDEKLLQIFLKPWFKVRPFCSVV